MFMVMDAYDHAMGHNLKRTILKTKRYKGWVTTLASRWPQDGLKMAPKWPPKWFQKSNDMSFDF